MKKVSKEEIEALGGAAAKVEAKEKVVIASPKGVLKYERTNIAEIVDWVINALGEGEVVRGQAPSAAAYAMYLWAKENMNEFYTSYAARLLPTRAAIDKRDRFTDDGSGVGRLVEMLSAGEDAGF